MSVTKSSQNFNKVRKKAIEFGETSVFNRNKLKYISEALIDECEEPHKELA